MNRTRWTNRNNDGATPLENELNALQDENRRLKGLLELREDRTELERFQIHSRNRILWLMLISVVLIVTTFGASMVYHVMSTNHLKQEFQRDMIYKYKNATVVIPQN